MGETRCEHCKRVIGDSEPRMSFYDRKLNMCMSCEGAKIDVYKMEMDGNYYFDPDPENIYTAIENMDIDDKFTVTKETMLHSKLLRMPEFEGF